MVLRRLVVSMSGSAHQCNIHISPKVVPAAKTLIFSNNNGHTFVGCTSGITPFAVPWKSAEAVNEALADERYFDEATLKIGALRRARGCNWQTMTIARISPLVSGQCRRVRAILIVQDRFPFPMIDVTTRQKVETRGTSVSRTQ